MTCAHVAFTIGTCYHVSDATSRNRADSPHGALPSLSVVRFLWCVSVRAIVGGSVNLIACLIRSIPAVRGCAYSSTGAGSSRM
jgi:hypothetical protein